MLIPLAHNHRSRSNQITSVPKLKAASSEPFLSTTMNSLLPTRSSLRQLVITQFHPQLPLLHPPHRYTTTLQTPTLTVHLSSPSRSTTKKMTHKINCSFFLLLVPHLAAISTSYPLHHSPCKLPTNSHTPALDPTSEGTLANNNKSKSCSNLTPRFQIPAKKTFNTRSQPLGPWQATLATPSTAIPNSSGSPLDKVGVA